jgi:alpha-maltose-1-phosphate synthase
MSFLKKSSQNQPKQVPLKKGRLSIMRICQIGTGFTSIPPQISAATEEVTFNLCRELTKLGCDVQLVDILDRKRPPTNLRIHEVPYFSFLKTTKSNSPGLIAKRISFSFFSTLKLCKIKQDFDVLHFHNQFPAFIFQLAAKLSTQNVPTIFTLHNPVWGLPDSEMPKNVKTKFALEIEAMSNANKIVAVSETLRTNIINYLHLKPSSITVIPNGVDSDLFSPLKVPATLRKTLNLDGKEIILCAGRISRYKGQKMVINAIPKIIEKNPNAKFVFVGPLDDVRYFQEIRELIDSQSLGKYCIFTGNVPSRLIPDYFALADVFVLPSITEGLALTLLQAMSCGKAIVASSIPQNMEVAKQGDEIIFVNPLKTDELSSAIVQLLADEGKRKKIGYEARMTILRHFDWKIIAKETLQLYENVIGD